MGASKKIKRKEKISLVITICIVFMLLIVAAAALFFKFSFGSEALTSDDSSWGISSLSDALLKDPISSPEELKTESFSAVPESEDIGEEYFQDAVFIGDSLMMGLGAYGVVDKEKVLADVGLNLDTIWDKQCISTPSGAVTVLDAINLKKPKKIYLMMGSNGIAWVSPDVLADKIELFLSQIMAQQPDSEIYLMSIPPVTQAKFEKDSRYNNASIDQYNALLLQLAEKKEIHYLDINSAFKDESGALNIEYAEADGMHFKKIGYDYLYQYLRTHTAKN